MAAIRRTAMSAGALAAPARAATSVEAVAKPLAEPETELAKLACPICYHPLVSSTDHKSAPSKSDSSLECSTCKKVYSKDDYWDLTVVVALTEYSETRPAATELFRVLLPAIPSRRPLARLVRRASASGTPSFEILPGRPAIWFLGSVSARLLRSVLISVLFCFDYFPYIPRRRPRTTARLLRRRCVSLANRRFEMAKSYLKPKTGGIIVDASCGSGLFSRLFVQSELYCLVVALDYSENMLKQCKEFIKQESVSDERLALVRADISRLPFVSSSIDAVHAGAAILCWPSPASAVAEISRVLRPGGIFVASTFIADALPAAAPLLRIGRRYIGQITGINIFLSELELEDLCRACALVKFTFVRNGSYIMFSAAKVI